MQDRIQHSSIAALAFALLCACWVVRAQDAHEIQAESSPPRLGASEAGEHELAAPEREKRLLAMADFFKASPAISAHIVAQVEDLMGKRTLEGELLLDRSGRMLRRFTKPTLKVWLLDNALLTEYLQSKQAVYVKDFSNAPRMLSLLQAAVTVDFKTLEKLFDIRAYEGPCGLRLLLLKKASVGQALLYKSIQARILPNGIFFSEIEYVPDEGDKTVEKYVDIKPIADLSDAAFALDLPAAATRYVTALNDSDDK